MRQYWHGGHSVVQEWNGIVEWQPLRVRTNRLALCENCHYSPLAECSRNRRKSVAARDHVRLAWSKGRGYARTLSNQRDCLRERDNNSISINSGIRFGWSCLGCIAHPRDIETCLWWSLLSLSMKIVTITLCTICEDLIARIVDGEIKAILESCY